MIRLGRRRVEEKWESGRESVELADGNFDRAVAEVVVRVGAAYLRASSGLRRRPSDSKKARRSRAVSGTPPKVRAKLRRPSRTVLISAVLLNGKVQMH